MAVLERFEQRPAVVTEFDAQTRGETEDAYFAKIIKYIPGDVVAVYLGISSILASVVLSDKARLNWQWGLAAGLLVFTPAWVLLTQKKPKPSRPSLYFQAVYAMVAFATWVFALGGPFETCCGLPEGATEPVPGKWWQPLWGGAAILAVTFVASLVEKLYFWLYLKLAGIPVPDLKNMTKRDASTQLKDLGLNPDWEPGTAQDDWLVYRQEPEGPEKVFKGSLVKVWLQQP
jgi:hypothetical protein